MRTQTTHKTTNSSQVAEKRSPEKSDQKRSEPSFSDNRPDAVQLREMKESANNSPQAKQISRMQEVSGFAQSNSGSSPIQLKTKITHTTKPFTYPQNGNNVTEPVGAEMSAYLDPTDAVVGTGTDTSAGAPQLDLLHSLNANNRMVRGHLLNHDLGGFAVEENLYPITTSANNKHKTHVENPVGQALQAAHALNNGSGVYYSVKVNPIQNTSNNLVNNTSAFVCEAYRTANMTPGSVGTKGTLILKATIESMPGGVTASTAFDPGGGDLLSAVKAVIPAWDHGTRKGKANWDTYVAAGKISTVEGWSTAKQVLVGLGVGTITILAIAGYFYYNPDKMPAFLSNLMSNGTAAVEELLKSEL